VTASTVTTVAPARLAPYALVRLAALAYPTPPSGSEPFRAGVAELIRIRRGLAALAAALTDALHDTAGAHPTPFRQRVVLPVRRAVHNGRPLRPALLAALGDLPDRVPALRTWLDLTAAEADVLARLAADAPAALAAERAVLAALCRSVPVRRGVTLIGDDLLHGIERVATAGDPPSARARRAEPNALRYALRACAKTSPLSWFTHVAWGEWQNGGDMRPPEPLATARTNHTLLARLLDAVRADPAVRHSLLYRAAPAVHLDADRVSFRRDVRTGGDRVHGSREEVATLRLTRPVALLLTEIEPGGVAWSRLVDALAARLPGPPEHRGKAAADYVDRTIEAGLLVPVEPVHPQDPDALGALAGWLDRVDRPALARSLRAVRAEERAFGALPADARVAALTRLRNTWRDAFEAAGARWRDAPVLTEDVVLRTPVRLDSGSAAGLTELTALAELFDPELAARRLVRNRFVARFGTGGTCRHLAEYADLQREAREAWAAADDPDLAEVEALRAAVRAELTGDADEVQVPDDLPRRVERAMPGWMRGRPASYSFFVQPAGGLLVVNHVYPGWGRFTSRFLDALGPPARAAVARHLRAALGDGVTQLRPVCGFNANLHPLLVPREIGEDAAWADIDAGLVSAHHDPVSDQIRLRHEPTGEPLDVLYLGFLMPSLLPARLAPLATDLGGGSVDLGRLATGRAVATGDGCRVRPRIRYRDVVITRRSWSLPATAVAAWRRDLDTDVPFDAVTRWVARLGLPTEVFVAPGKPPPTRAADALRDLGRPKPQYVDLANALHLRCLSRTLARHPDGVRISEALPVPGSRHGRVLELVAETYRSEVGP